MGSPGPCSIAQPPGLQDPVQQPASPVLCVATVAGLEATERVATVLELEPLRRLSSRRVPEAGGAWKRMENGLNT